MLVSRARYKSLGHITRQNPAKFRSDVRQQLFCSTRLTKPHPTDLPITMGDADLDEVCDLTVDFLICTNTTHRYAVRACSNSSSKAAGKAAQEAVVGKTSNSNGMRLPR